MVNTIEEMLKDFEKGTYDFTCNGKCIGCGECCSNILPMTKQEIERIKAYIKEHNIEEHKNGMFLMNPICDMTCPFLNDSKDHRCNIYEVRPQICRNFSCHKENRAKIPTSVLAEPIDVRHEFYGGESMFEAILGVK